MLRTFDNRTYELRFDGSLSRFWHGDTLAEYRKDGTPSLIHTQDVTMVRGTREQFYFDSQLPGGTHVVGWGPHEGYVERVVPSGGGRYMQRTYLVRGRQITAVFHTVDFNGVTLALYVPQRRYRPAFYTSVERKWPRGLHFGWPLLNENWAEPYRQHFRREYPSFSSWLADYLFAGILQAEFVSSPQTISPNSPGAFYTSDDAHETPHEAANTALSDPELSDTVANFDEQVRGYEAAPISQDFLQSKDSEDIPSIVAASSAPEETVTREPITPPAAPPHRVAIRGGLYIVNSPLIFHTDELNCSITKDSWLRVPAQLLNATVNATVLKSMPGDCPNGTRIPLDLRQLNEMENNFEMNFNEASRIGEVELQRIGLIATPVGAVQSVLGGKPIPGLTDDAVSQIVQQGNRAVAAEQAVIKDMESARSQSNKQ